MRANLLLLLLLAAPAAHAQEAAPPSHAARGPLRAESSAPLPASAEPRSLVLRADALPATELQNVRAQPTGRDFLYQIALVAVSTLVTALVWKAVF